MFVKLESKMSYFVVFERFVKSKFIYTLQACSIFIALFSVSFSVSQPLYIAWPFAFLIFSLSTTNIWVYEKNLKKWKRFWFWVLCFALKYDIIGNRPCQWGNEVWKERVTVSREKKWRLWAPMLGTLSYMVEKERNNFGKELV